MNATSLCADSVICTPPPLTASTSWGYLLFFHPGPRALRNGMHDRRTLGHTLHPANSPCPSGCWQGSAVPCPLHTQGGKASEMACSIAPRKSCTVLKLASGWASLQPGGQPCPECRACQAAQRRGRHSRSYSACTARTGTCRRGLEGGLPRGSRVGGPSPGRRPSLQTPEPGRQQGRPGREDVPRDATADGHCERPTLKRRESCAGNPPLGQPGDVANCAAPSCQARTAANPDASSTSGRPGLVLHGAAGLPRRRCCRARGSRFVFVGVVRRSGRSDAQSTGLQLLYTVLNGQ